MPGFPGTPAERFWPKVERVEGCWRWLASLDAYGYGQFYDGRTMVKAHRFAYELVIGPIPDGLDIDHLCSNRACVNPAHMEPVTRRENLLRGETLPADQVTRTHCPQGHEYTTDNTRVSRRGSRACRACDRQRNRRKYHERKR